MGAATHPLTLMDGVLFWRKKTRGRGKMGKRYAMSGVADWLEATWLRKISAKKNEKEQEREKGTREDHINVGLKGQTRLALTS